MAFLLLTLHALQLIFQFSNVFPLQGYCFIILIQQLGLDDEAAAGVAEVSIDFVRKVRADLEKKKK